MAGRGSFIESFPLFGYDLDDYDELFAEKLDLLLALRDVRARHVVGPPPRRRSTTPASTRARCRIRCRCGSPSAARRSRSCAPGRSGCRSRVAIIGGAPERFAPLVDLYRDAARQAGHDPAALPVGDQLARLRRADTSQQAAERYFPAYAAMMTRIGRERGWPPMTRAQFDALRAPRGALVVGSPQEVIEKILLQHELFGHQRFLAQISVGDLPHDNVHARDRAARHGGRARRARRGRAPRPRGSGVERGEPRGLLARARRDRPVESGAKGSSSTSPSS